MTAKGGARPGAGRPAGLKNASTLAREDALNSAIGPFQGTAKEFLQTCMQNERLSASMRLDAAKTLIQYEEAKLSTVTINEKRSADRESVKTELAGLSSEELAKIVQLGQPRPTGRPRKHPLPGSTPTVEDRAA